MSLVDDYVATRWGKVVVTLALATFMVCSIVITYSIRQIVREERRQTCSADIAAHLGAKMGLMKEWVVGFMQIRCIAIGYMFGLLGNEKAARQFGDLLHRFSNSALAAGDEAQSRYTEWA